MINVFTDVVDMSQLVFLLNYVQLFAQKDVDRTKNAPCQISVLVLLDGWEMIVNKVTLKFVNHS